MKLLVIFGCTVQTHKTQGMPVPGS